jgi:hypothetical protein
MRHLFLILGVLFFVTINSEAKSIKNINTKEFETASMASYRIKTDCFAAVNKEKFDEVTRASVRKNSDAITSLMLRGYVVILKKGTEVNVVSGGGIGIKKVQVLSGTHRGSYFYVASEFVY